MRNNHFCILSTRKLSSTRRNRTRHFSAGGGGGGVLSVHIEYAHTRTAQYTHTHTHTHVHTCTHHDAQTTHTYKTHAHINTHAHAHAQADRSTRVFHFVRSGTCQIQLTDLSTGAHTTVRPFSLLASLDCLRLHDSCSRVARPQSNFPCASPCQIHNQNRRISEFSASSRR